jgi:hypothetical protein
MRHYKLRTEYNCPTDRDNHVFCHEIRDNATPDLKAVAAFLACNLHAPQPPFKPICERRPSSARVRAESGRAIFEPGPDAEAVMSKCGSSVASRRVSKCHEGECLEKKQASG